MSHSDGLYNAGDNYPSFGDVYFMGVEATFPLHEPHTVNQRLTNLQTAALLQQRP